MKRLGFGLLLAAVMFTTGHAKVGGGDIELKAKGAGPVKFSHDSHVNGAGLKCTACHASLYITQEKHVVATMARMRKGKSCGACHNGKKAFTVKENCNTCHAKPEGGSR